MDTRRRQSNQVIGGGGGGTANSNEKFLCRRLRVQPPAQQGEGKGPGDRRKWQDCVWLWDNQVGTFGTHQTYYWKVNFHLIDKSHAGISLNLHAERGTPNKNLNYNTWSPRNLFLGGKFNFISKLHAAIPFPCIQRKG